MVSTSYQDCQCSVHQTSTGSRTVDFDCPMKESLQKRKEDCMAVRGSGGLVVLHHCYGSLGIHRVRRPVSLLIHEVRTPGYRVCCKQMDDRHGCKTSKGSLLCISLDYDGVSSSGICLFLMVSFPGCGVFPGKVFCLDPVLSREVSFCLSSFADDHTSGGRRPTAGSAGTSYVTE